MGTTLLLSPTVTVSNSPAYTAGDSVGGKLTLTNALGSNNKGIVREIVLVDQAKQNAAMTLLFFSADPSGTTFTDNGALDVADADMSKIIGKVNIAAGDYAGLADNSVASVASLAIPLEGADRTIYAHLFTTGTPTFAASTDVVLKIYIES